jgi:hypothetical protein
MFKRTRIVAFAFLAFVVHYRAPSSFACLCNGSQPPCAAFQEASAVFVGTVTAITKWSKQQGDVLDELLVQFSIEQSFKHASASEITIATVTGTECDLGFKNGEKYLVYAYKDSRHDHLATGICTRTKLLSEAKQDIDYFRRTNGATNIPPVLAGTAGRLYALEGAQVIIESSNKKYAATIGYYGDFEVELAEPGKYWVTIIGPFGYEIETFREDWKVFSKDGRHAVKFEREVAAGHCDFVILTDYITVAKR